MEQLVEQLFVEGVAHDAQWKFPSKQFIAPYDQERVLEALQIRFGPGTSLINQLPPDDSDPLKSAFYNIAENWFYQIFNREGYDALVVASSLLRWLRGDINTIVLCGGRLSTAKTAFNAIASCFPMAVIDGNINNLSSVAEIAPHAALYCLPLLIRNRIRSCCISWRGTPLRYGSTARMSTFPRFPCSSIALTYHSPANSQHAKAAPSF